MAERFLARIMFPAPGGTTSDMDERLLAEEVLPQYSLLALMLLILRFVIDSFETV
jgi:hypothetical protein